MVHTPRGLLRALVIYVQFAPQGQGHGYNGTMANWPLNNLPSNQEEFFYTNESQFYPGDDTKNISNFFYQHSNPDYPFMFVGEAFPHLITIPIFPEDANISSAWDEFIRRALDSIQVNHSDFDWSRFDRRKNRVGSGHYQTDNSVEDPDNVLDFVVIRFRFWDNALRPTEEYQWLTQRTGENAWNMIISHPLSDSISTDFFSGFTMAKGNVFESVFIHEFAHNLFGSGHQVDANKQFGKHFNMTYGYSFIHRTALHSINAWDRWWLDWIDIKHDLSDVQHNGDYWLRDFITTGDAMRIKLRTPDGQYVWVENRTGATVWDDRRDPEQQIQGYTIPPAPQGAIMFLEGLSDDRVERTGSGNPNRIKFLYHQGNFDYARSSDFSTHFSGRNRLYHFDHLAANPFGGHNDHSEIRDDYYTEFLDINNNDLGDSTPNGVINYNPADGFILNESFPVFNRDNSFIFGMYGSELGFPAGKKISISTNPGLVAHQRYDKNSFTLDPIYLHGLSVQVLQYQGTGVNRKAKIRVKYDDYVVDRDVRWCGNIILPAGVPLELKEGKNITLDKSGTPNRHTLTPAGDFINPTTLTFEEEATFTLRANSNMYVRAGSTLHLEPNSKLTIAEGAKLYIRSNSALQVDGCAELEVLPGGEVIVETAGTLQLSHSAILNVHDGQVAFNINNAAIIPEGFPHPNDLLLPSYHLPSGNYLWESVSYNIHTPLTIESGAHLMLNDASLQFSQGGSIEVMQGGTLTVFSASLSPFAGCGEAPQWQGIHVQEGGTLVVGSCAELELL